MLKRIKVTSNLDIGDSNEDSLSTTSTSLKTKFRPLRSENINTQALSSKRYFTNLAKGQNQFFLSSYFRIIVFVFNIRLL